VLCRLIRDAGFTPAQRDNAYDLLAIHADESSPDLLVDDWSEHRARALHAEKTASAAPDPVAVTMSLSSEPARA